MTPWRGGARSSNQLPARIGEVTTVAGGCRRTAMPRCHDRIGGRVRAIITTEPTAPTAPAHAATAPSTSLTPWLCRRRHKHGKSTRGTSTCSKQSAYGRTVQCVLRVRLLSHGYDSHWRSAASLLRSTAHVTHSDPKQGRSQARCKCRRHDPSRWKRQCNGKRSRDCRGINLNKFGGAIGINVCDDRCAHDSSHKRGAAVTGRYRLPHAGDGPLFRVLTARS